MSHLLHAPSLYFASTLIEAIAALLMLRALRAPRDPFLSYWAAHAAIFAVASGLVGLQGRIAEPILVLLGPAFGSAGDRAALARRRAVARRAPLALARADPAGPLAPRRLASPDPRWPYRVVAAVFEPRLGAGARRRPGMPKGPPAAPPRQRARPGAAARSLAARWYAWRIAEALFATPRAGSPPWLGWSPWSSADRSPSSASPSPGTMRRRRRPRRCDAAQAEMERLHAGLPAVIFLREIGRRPDLPPPLPGRRHPGGDRLAAGRDRPDRELGRLHRAGCRFGGLYAAALRDGQTQLDWRMRRPDGGWTWLRTTLRILERRPDGSALAVGYIANIAAERRAERAEAARRRSTAPWRRPRSRSSTAGPRRMAASTAATSAAASSG